ncbi:ABC transporter permease [Ferrovibrio xuzhouensis]|uniref:ABC transporter permease n=1 Tax=Ferrovibrio xuzhouensis TaxID=1576914 RepID=A0ABV7VLN4_9PROT
MPRRILAVLLVLVATFVGAVVFFLALGKPPLAMIGSMVMYAFGDTYSISETLVKATPILFCAMATIIPARLGLISVGADGQLYMGALVATGVMIAAHDLGLGWLLFPLVGLAAIVGGAVWGIIPAYLKARIGVHETITTLLLNYIAALLVNFVVYGPWKDTGNLGWPATISFPPEAALPTLFGTRVNLGFIIAVAIALVVHWYLSRSRVGVELRVLRENRALGSAIGLNFGRAALMTMAIGGALAGLSGWGEASAVQGRLQPGLSLGYGLTGFLVGWLSGHNMLWAVVLSVLIGGLYSAGDALQDIAKVPAASAMVLQGVLFVVALSVSGWDRLRAGRHG